MTRYLDAVRTEKTLIRGRYEEGKTEGLVEGEQKGIRATAARMLKAGVDITIIMQCTGLSAAEIDV